MNLTHARELTKFLISKGSKNIKFYYNTPGRNSSDYLHLCKEVVRTANEYNIPVVAHISPNSGEDALRCGVKGLVHGLFNEASDEFIRLLKQNNAFYSPTFQIHDGYYQLTNRILFNETIDNLKYMIDIRTRDRILSIPKLPKPNRTQIFRDKSIALKNLKRIFDAGIQIITGTDCGLPANIHGAMIHREFYYHQLSGIKPLDVLSQTTSIPSKVFKFNHGIIKIGYNADLLVLNDDPSKDVRNFRSILSTIRLGYIHNYQK
jgi:imidazolonepropionase-like amidohydrolase